MHAQVIQSLAPEGSRPAAGLEPTDRGGKKSSRDASQGYRDAPAQSSAALPWLDVKGAAERAQISEGYACTLCTTGHMRSVKRGRLRRIRPEWVDQWVAGDRA